MKDLNLGMFKPYDIRTKIEKLSQENLKRLSEAVAIYYKTILKAPAVVIGRDARQHMAACSLFCKSAANFHVSVLL